ncbi:MAG: hypothetical protein JSV86_19930 [Gemmatimonadota bacterium]|nr:MAG: hypothetical protein JSV86_19930 [Gemmatimonadota bacterium]
MLFEMFGRWKDLERRLETCEARLETMRELAGEVHNLTRQVEEFHLDYHQLYERVRTNLAKLRKRAEKADGDEAQPDPLAEARKALLLRKTRRL